MYLYFYDKYEKGSDKKGKSGKLVMTALSQYCYENNIKGNIFKIEIQKTENGKPYIKNEEFQNIKFNISHSDSLWICAISNSDVGIDLQKIVDKNYAKIAKRYYTKEEQNFVKTGGQNAFFDIWVRKEAYAKLYALSIFNIIDKINTVENDRLRQNIDKVIFSEISIVSDAKCVVATEEGDEVCLRTIK